MECTHYQYRLLNINPPNIASTRPRYRACNRRPLALSGSFLAQGLSPQPRGGLRLPLGAKRIINAKEAKNEWVA